MTRPETSSSDRQASVVDLDARALMDSLEDAVFIHDFQGRMFDINQAACTRLGYTREELLKQGLQAIDSPEFANQVPDRMAALRKTGKGLFESVHLCKNGKGIPVEVNARLIEFNGTTLVIGVSRDITERKLAEQEKTRIQSQLLHSSKLASIGTLAAGVAHEINNPLTIIRGQNEFIRESLILNEADPKMIQTLDKQEQAIGRIAGIVNSLRLYARNDNSTSEEVNIHQIIQETLSLVANIYKRAQIQIETQLRSINPTTAGNIGQMQQVILNLIVNAKDALEGRKSGGLIRLETEDVGTTAIVLRLSDNGCGMHPNQLQQIFNAFYTTKPPGKGTGLGLPISHSIITSMKGTIDVASEPGVGTVFTLTLPKLR
ncbi:MAG TPA: hypothetical protein DCS07_02635 [Bdellovibrionales bacterium]|nr:MAG: hypothetical protein A2Z97_06760 [Bdellovibrionales bacterium GWB1_52_6]OFZ05490.1 MAG: hypothetical protein A2X97_11480 [Bdellovibrionales bacterium GWA1_52_35]OFZ36296.1 MAG: hypothetical protein A2070_12990 [Bdellovibrionales bacterium GWC1_52_8]HAR41521.1 hypothetical protein [Bdellovibrionales bacterium]HCM39145.1 hypothetical protein [Bdellovibrionales bacterium]